MWLEDVQAVLEDAAVATFGEDLFFSTKAAPVSMPSGGYLVVIETTGGPSEKIHNQKAPRFLMPGAQVSGVADDYVTARAKAQAALDALSGKVNVTINGTFYRGIRTPQEVFDGGLNGRGQATAKFNITGDKLSTATGEDLMGYFIVDVFGGDRTSFVAPSVADAYFSGTTYDKLVPDSVSMMMSHVPPGRIVLEASAAVDVASGARAKVGLFNLDADTLVAEIAFDADVLVGQRKRSAVLNLSPNVTYGVKMTTDDVAVACAAWGCRLIHL